MRKIIFKISFVFILFTYGYIEASGQNITSNLNEEKISLFTDRTLYISGEQIQFAAYLYINCNSNSTSYYEIKSIDDLNKLSKSLKKSQYNFSNTIYVELITPEGEKIAGGKFQNENSCSAGCIPIPKDIVTGMYYIRAYTRFMRNSGPDSYYYISLKIVNPSKSEILTYNYVNGSSRNSIIPKDTSNIQEFFTVSTDKEEYSIRDRVNIQIKGVNLKENTLGGLSLTVIPDFSTSDGNKIKPVTKNSLTNQYYYPETKGISLTGKLKDSKSEKPITNTIVNLSILGNCKDFMAVKTDSFGRFFFKMPDFKGSKDVFLSTESMVDSKSTILIDNEFCQDMVSIPTPPFQLTEMERKVAFNLALNLQIASHFNKNSSKDSVKYIDKPFYGEPQGKLIFDNYVQLPTVEDYITELIPILSIRKHQGKKHFKIYSTQSEMNFYNPLVLLDMVAIDNPEKILSVPPQRISRIEIVNAAYIKGDITYGGIISVFSKKGDFAGIDLPSSGLFLDYNFWSDCTNSYSSETLTANQPDLRNTLLWEPKITLNPENSKEISFKTSDTPGKYIVLLRGITKEGKEFTYKKSFTVQTKS